MRRRLFVALTAATSIVGAFGTAAALPGSNDGAGAQHAATAEPFGYEGVTVSALPAATGGERLAVRPADGQTDAMLALLNDLGAAALREVGGIYDVSAPPTALDALEISPAVAAVAPLQVAHETSVTGVSGGAAADQSLPLADETEVVSASSGSLASSRVASWQQAGYTGEGTTIAVIDTGFAGWATAEGASQVPAIAAGDDYDFCDQGYDGRPHGTATAGVIHNVALDARIVRVCIDDAMDLSAATSALIARGDIDLINMALGFYNTGPGDGTGGPGSPDDSVRRAMAAGIIWVNSAGNEAPLHYACPFTDANDDRLHEFAGTDEYGMFVVPAHSDVEVFLRWNEWATAPADVFRLCFTISDGGALNCIDAAQPERNTPTTGVAFTNSRNDAVTFYVAIKRMRGTGAPNLDLFFTEASNWEHPVAPASLVEPAAVPGVVAVGAACSDTGLVQPVSSQGPTADGRPGITLVAPGVSVAGLFDPSADCQDGYGGTSAAAPHVSGALALLKQADPSAHGNDLIDQLVARTAAGEDPGAPGVDPVYGYGVMSLGTPPPFAPAVVSSELSFQVALHSDRSGAEPLTDQVLSGAPFIWLTPLIPDPPPQRVEFYIDDTLVNVEVWPTLDVGGGFAEQSLGVDTTRLADGRHRLTAAITRADGSHELAVANLNVANHGVGSALPGVLAAGGVAVHGRTVAADDTITLQVGPATPAPIAIVNFFVDAVHVGTADAAPYELHLGDLSGLGAGQHMVRAIAIGTDGSRWAVDANFALAG